MEGHIGLEQHIVLVAEERSLVEEGVVAQGVLPLGRGSVERHKAAGVGAGPVAVPSPPAVAEAAVDTVVGSRSCRTSSLIFKRLFERSFG